MRVALVGLGKLFTSWPAAAQWPPCCNTGYHCRACRTSDSACTRTELAYYAYSYSISYRDAIQVITSHNPAQPLGQEGIIHTRITNRHMMHTYMIPPPLFNRLNYRLPHTCYTSLHTFILVLCSSANTQPHN